MPKKPKKVNRGQSQRNIRANRGSSSAFSGSLPPALKAFSGRDAGSATGFTRLTTDQKGTSFLVKTPTGSKRTRNIEPFPVEDLQRRRTETQAPTLTRRKQKQSESEEFCKIVINKKTGKRKRICRVKDVPIRKRKRSKAIADNIPTIPTPRLARFL